MQRRPCHESSGAPREEDKAGTKTDKNRTRAMLPRNFDEVPRPAWNLAVQEEVLLQVAELRRSTFPRHSAQVRNAH